jgi:hypothetical protein
MSTFESTVVCVPNPCGTDHPALLRRIEAEFREMPGLTLTLPQAARLFSLNSLDCERVLQALVRAGQLRFYRGSFALAGDGSGSDIH